MSRFVLVVTLALASAPDRGPSEQFIRANYVKDDGPKYDTGYPRVATNRFRQAWVVAQQELSPFLPFYYRSVGGLRVHLLEDGSAEPYVPSQAFREAVNQVIGCIPQVSQYRDELFTPERVRLQNGEEIVTFYLYRLRDHSDNQPLWLSGLVVSRDGGCASLQEAPKRIDLDRGGTTRELWDTFEFAGKRFVLAHTYGYEERGFELFRVANGHLSPELGFSFACVGCD